MTFATMGSMTFATMGSMTWHTFMCCIIYMCAPSALFAIPDWAKENSFSQRKNILEIVCSGKGPSMEQARAEAIASCKTTASNQLNKNTEIKSLSIETERTVAFHQEVAENFRVSSLSCKVIKESVEERDGFFEIWNKCQFDLAKAKVSGSRETAFKEPNHFESGDHLVSILSVPACDDILVRGQMPRKIECKARPTSVVLKKGDQELIVRAKDCAPKTVRLNADMIASEIIRVNLERIN